MNDIVLIWESRSLPYKAPRNPANAGRPDEWTHFFVDSEDGVLTVSHDAWILLRAEGVFDTDGTVLKDPMPYLYGEIGANLAAHNCTRAHHEYVYRENGTMTVVFHPDPE